MKKKEESFFESQCLFICEQTSLKILDVNENVTSLFGVEKEQLIGNRFTDFGVQINANNSDFSLNKFSGFSAEQIWKFEFENDEPHFFQFSFLLINYKGKPSKLVVGHDVSDSLFQRQKKVPLSSPIEFSNFPLAEIEWNNYQKILRWSPKAEDLFGYSQEEVINHPNLLKTFVHPDDLEGVVSKFQKSLDERKKSTSSINRNITKSGDVIYCEWYNSFLFDDNGKLVSTYSLVVDVTQRIQAMTQAKRSMASYIDLFNSFSDAIYLVDNDGLIINANEGTLSTFGYDRTDLINKHYKILSAPGKFDAERLDTIDRNELEKKSVRLEGWGKRINNEVFPTEMLVSAGLYLDQEVLVIIERDISERKQAEEELKKRENLLSELFNKSPLGIALLNTHSEIIEINEGFEKLFEFTKEEIVGLEIDRVIVPENLLEDAKRLSSIQYVEEELSQRKKKSGEIVDVIIYTVPIIIDEVMVYQYGIYVDISDRKEAEKNLKKSLKEKEVLLAEIHHRVKNNLAVITGLLELQSYSTKSENAKSILRHSQLRIHSIALVHEKLYDNDNFSEIKVQDYLKELGETIVQTMNKDDITIELNYDLDNISLPITQAIPCGLLLNEILTNSYKHAFVGMEKGRIDVEFKQHNNDLTFRISDNGVGFDSSEPIKKRNSLGLKLIRTLSKQLGAKMNISSETGSVLEIKFKRGELNV